MEYLIRGGVNFLGIHFMSNPKSYSLEPSITYDIPNFGFKRGIPCHILKDNTYKNTKKKSVLFGSWISYQKVHVVRPSKEPQKSLGMKTRKQLFYSGKGIDFPYLHELIYPTYGIFRICMEKQTSCFAHNPSFHALVIRLCMLKRSTKVFNLNK